MCWTEQNVMRLIQIEIFLNERLSELEVTLKHCSRGSVVGFVVICLKAQFLQNLQLTFFKFIYIISLDFPWWKEFYPINTNINTSKKNRGESEDASILIEDVAQVCERHSTWNSCSKTMFLAKINPTHCLLGRSVFIMYIQWTTPSIIQYVQYSVLCSRLKIVISVVSLTFSPYQFFSFSHCFPPFLRFIFFILFLF